MKIHGDMRWSCEDHCYVYSGRQQSCNCTFYCWLCKWLYENDFIQGKVKANKNRKNVTVKKPYFVERYNAYMRAVFKSDQMLFKYNLLLKCVRWWKTLVFHMIDISIVNSCFIQRISEKSSIVRINEAFKKLLSD